MSLNLNNWSPSATNDMLGKIILTCIIIAIVYAEFIQ